MKTFYDLQSKIEDQFYNDIPAINWNTVIDRMEAGDYDGDDYDEWDERANDWVTCACGNQCEAIPRGYTGAPKDAELFRLGGQFPVTLEVLHEAVEVGQGKASLKVSADVARQCLADIERRSSEILAEMEAVKNGDPA